MSRPAKPARNWAQWNPWLKVMAARVVFLVMVLASLIAVTGHENAADYLPFYIFMLVALLTTMVYGFGVRSEKSAGNSVIHQFAVDPVIVTGMVYFTGGIDSQLYLLYPLLILAAGITVSAPHVFHVTILSVVLYSLLTVALFLGVLVVPGVSTPPAFSGVEVFESLMFRNLVFIMVGGATTYFSGMLTRQEATIRRIGMVASSILENVGTALLATDAAGQVVSVNKSAALLLGQSEDDLRGKPLNMIFEGEGPDLNAPRQTRKVWTVKRTDKTTFPAFCALSKGKFPALNDSGGSETAELTDLFLVALFDMSDSPAAVNNDDHRERVEVVNEMAHVVRNPLTAIRGAGELLSSAVDHMFAGSGKLSSDDWEMIKTMSSVIFEQSMELDDKVKDFLEGVAAGSTQVEEALHDARAWADAVKKEKENG